MKLKAMHEKPFIAELLSGLITDANFVNGFGQDASVMDIGFGDTAIALKIDRAAKPIAAIRGWTDYSMWGALAVTANCSDLLAVGARPKGFMISMSLPGDWNAVDAKKIVYGAQEECTKNGVALLGGDTKESNEPHIVGCAFGLVDRSKILSRRRGQPGDLLVLAGSLGGFVGAYLSLDAGVRGGAAAEYVTYLAKPSARWADAEFINSSGLATSGTDLSDGLYEGILNVVSDGAGAVLDLERLPYHKFAHQANAIFGVPLINLSFSVGDWSILYAVPEEHRQAIERAKNLGCNLTVIGKIDGQSGVRAQSSHTGKRYIVQGIVNQHFDHRLEDEGSFLEKIRTNVGLLEIG
ncbi:MULTISPECIES: thiamine-phosphate kinase [Paraburkholderia]|uniref:Thiamine-monophosphate kinase n=1 Tax=Paraburkholderia podalyriae TaxID=1938811 RepID=A0ABR7PSP2_9BURK|nr:AIR synthase related protein [Paraburkholderia podalyriae]MBC8749309.1 hypothetical protein [Paraburkholderia podalyriae]